MSAANDVIQSNDSSMTSPEPGLWRQVMSYSPNLMLVRHKIEPGWAGAAHSHPHEQLVYVVSAGKLPAVPVKCNVTFQELPAILPLPGFDQTIHQIL